MLAEQLLGELDTLKEKPLEQFILLTCYLKDNFGKLFNSKVASTYPLDVKMRINFGDMEHLLDECTMRLVADGTSYIVDKNKTLYVHIEDSKTLQLIIKILRRVVASRCRVEVNGKHLVAV